MPRARSATAEKNGSEFYLSFLDAFVSCGMIVTWFVLYFCPFRKHPELLQNDCRFTLQQTKSWNNRQDLELVLQWRNKNLKILTYFLESILFLFRFLLSLLYLQFETRLLSSVCIFCLDLCPSHVFVISYILQTLWWGGIKRRHYSHFDLTDGHFPGFLQLLHLSLQQYKRFADQPCLELDRLPQKKNWCRFQG